MADFVLIKSSPCFIYLRTFFTHSASPWTIPLLMSGAFPTSFKTLDFYFSRNESDDNFSSGSCFCSKFASLIASTFLVSTWSSSQTSLQIPPYTLVGPILSPRILCILVVLAIHSAVNHQTTWEKCRQVGYPRNEHQSAPVLFSVVKVGLKRAEFAKSAVGCRLAFQS